MTCPKMVTFFTNVGAFVRLTGCLIVTFVITEVFMWELLPNVYSVYLFKRSWSEARQICDRNNGTLLKIPDDGHWQMWIHILSEDYVTPYRTGESKYWIGAHAPIPKNFTLLYWDDCSEVTWTEWHQYRPDYSLQVPCVHADVRFQPFETLTMNLWFAEPEHLCTNSYRFICNTPISSSVEDACPALHCDEYVFPVSNNTECLSYTSSTTISHLILANGALLCHTYPSNPSFNIEFFQLCARQDVPVCSEEQWSTDYNVQNVDLPSNSCLTTPKETEVTTTTTTETTTPTRTTTRTITVAAVTSTEFTSTVSESSSSTFVTTSTTTETTSTTSSTTTDSKSTTTPLDSLTISAGITVVNSAPETTKSSLVPPNTTLTASSPTITINNQSNESECWCTCNKNALSPSELTPSAVEEKVQQLKKELTVDKKNTSLFRRKLISAKDNRVSATGIGSAGAAILVALAGSIVIMDLSLLRKDAIRILKNMKSIFARMSSQVPTNFSRTHGSDDTSGSICDTEVNGTTQVKHLLESDRFDSRVNLENLNEFRTVHCEKVTST